MRPSSVIPASAARGSGRLLGSLTTRDDHKGHARRRRRAGDHVALHVRSPGAGLREEGELLVGAHQRLVDAGERTALDRRSQRLAQRLAHGSVHLQVVLGRRRLRRHRPLVPLEGRHPLELVAHAAAVGRLHLTFVGDHRLGQQHCPRAEARVEPGGEAVAHQQGGTAHDHGIGRLGGAGGAGRRDRDPEAVVGKRGRLRREPRDDADAGPLSHGAPGPGPATCRSAGGVRYRA